VVENVSKEQTKNTQPNPPRWQSNPPSVCADGRWCGPNKSKQVEPQQSKKGGYTSS